MPHKNSYIGTSKKKSPQANAQQTSIFDFLEADNEPFPREADVITTGLDILNPVTATQLLKSKFKSLKNLAAYLSEFKFPIFQFPEELDTLYTKVIVNPKKYKLSRHYLVSTKFTVKVWNEEEFVDYPPNSDGLYELKVTDGTTFFLRGYEMVLSSFLGVKPWITSTEEREKMDAILKEVDDLFDLTGSFFEAHRLYLLEGVTHNLTNITIKPEPPLEPVDLPTDPTAEAEPMLQEVPNLDEEDHQPKSSSLIPIDIYGIKEGYWYDPLTKTVSSPSNIIVSHRLSKDGTLQLEAQSSDPHKVPLVTVNLDELHAVIFNGHKLLPSSHEFVEGEPEPHLKIAIETVPLELTDEMKEIIRNSGAGDNRQLAASVYGGKVTPEHTKVVKAYKKYLQEKLK